VKKYDSLSKIKYLLSQKYKGLFLELLSWRIFTISIYNLQSNKNKYSKNNNQNHRWNYENQRFWKKPSKKREIPWNSTNHWNSENQRFWKKPNKIRVNPWNSNKQKRWRIKKKKWRIKTLNNQTSQIQFQSQPQSETQNQPQNQIQPQSLIQTQIPSQIFTQDEPPLQQISNIISINEEYSRWEKRKPQILAENLLFATCEWDKNCDKKNSIKMKDRIKKECKQLNITIGSFCANEDGLEIGMVNFKRDWEKWISVMKWNESIDTLSSLISHLENNKNTQQEIKNTSTNMNNNNNTINNSNNEMKNDSNIENNFKNTSLI
jgi:hypothetical protein